MLRSALVAVALLAAVSCKKADSKEKAPATAADSEMARKDPPAVKDGSAEGVGTVKEPDAAAVTPGSGSDAVATDGSGTAKGTGDKPPVKGSGSTAKGSSTTTGDGSFSMTISSPDAVAAGAAATAKLTVKPGKGYHMNEEFPTNLKLEPPAGCTLAKTELGADDAVTFNKDELVFEVSCTPASAGTYNVSGKLKFAVCTDSTCDPKRQAIAFEVAAK